MSSLTPWARGPFELILHAEMHNRDSEDADRRIALIGFDNSIEVSITTYLTLNPIHRGGKEYSRDDVARWLGNFHTKIDFIEIEIADRGLTMEVPKADIIWYHSLRNDLYHGGKFYIPPLSDIEGIRKAAIWIFSVLFDITDTESIVDARIASMIGPVLPSKEDDFDRAIDDKSGLKEIGDTRYYSSELLHALDPHAYRELGLELTSDEEEDTEEADPE